MNSSNKNKHKGTNHSGVSSLTDWRSVMRTNQNRAELTVAFIKGVRNLSVDKIKDKERYTGSYGDIKVKKTDRN